MGLTLVTAPEIEPLTIAEVKAHLRIDASNTEPAPDAPTVALAGGGAGNVEDGAHRYRVTFVTADGETEGGTISSAVTVADKTVNGKVSLTSIPLGGSAVTARKVYRTVAGGSDYKLLATIADNTTTIYTDNIADASLGAGAPTTNSTGDPYLTALIQVAREWAEEYTGRALITQTWDYTIDSFPWSSCYQLELPKPNLQEVTSITYKDTSGDNQTWSSSKYVVDTASKPGNIVPAYSEVWPTTQDMPNAVTVRLVAGYGDAASDIPQSIKQAMLLYIGDLYNNRESVVLGVSVANAPVAAMSLLRNYRLVRF